MQKKQVSYCYCDEYNFEKVKDSIYRIFSSFPDFEKKLKESSGLKVLLKPNLLSPRHPDKAITTHPTVLKAVIHYLQQFDSKITIADTPAGPYNKKVLEKLYSTCQIDQVANEMGVELNFDLSDEYISLPEGKVLKKCMLIKPAIEADIIINIAKLKTHTLTRLTCATKNLFGLMPGVLKFRQHIAMPDIKIFSQMLLDINSYFEDKTFHIVDGITGMEGEGPSGGDPISTGALIGGLDSGAIDMLVCNIIGMPFNSVSTLINYKSLDDLEIKELDPIKKVSYKLPPQRNRSIPSNVPEWVQEVLTNLIIAKPLINKKNCKKCKLCIESCPAEIMTTENGFPKISSYKKCIRCYCCQEACPYKSIHLSVPLVEKIYVLIRKFKKKNEKS